MLKINYNYHTHTKRCGHASGEDEEYVLAAIKVGIKELGFSDHIFYPGLSQKPIRQDGSDFDDYVNSISNLREKYKDKIKIFLGFEAEYIEGFEDFYKTILDNPKIDYLICGNHCYYENNEWHWYFNSPNNKQDISRYVDRTIKAIESGLFLYIAHPDIFLNWYTDRDDFIIDQIRQICQKAKEYNLPLEINLEGAKHKVHLESLGQEPYYYPHDIFWQIASEVGNDIVVGIDAHNPDSLIFNHIDIAETIINKYKLRTNLNSLLSQ